jgi:L-alanine-DL-glutamate epimerase-like enolase superfamily enzyme
MEVKPLDATLQRSFPIASDQQSRMEEVDNALVVVKSTDGVVGYGEAAPFFGISGDTQDLLIEDISSVVDYFVGSGFDVFELEEFAREALEFPAARAAIEMAYLDILSKNAGVSASTLVNPSTQATSFTTDVTIPMVDEHEAHTLTLKYAVAGFDRIKVKVGGDLDEDLRRLDRIRKAHREVGRSKLSLLADANEGYNLSDALAFIRNCGTGVKIFEQPVRRHDFERLRAVKQFGDIFNIEVFADESVYTAQEAADLIEAGAVHGFNLKLMKHGGFVEALRIAKLAIDSGLQLMVGGMVETRLAMTAGLHLARTIGHAHLNWLDLDTPMLLEEDILTGGMIYDGPTLTLPDALGLGVDLK